MARTVRKVSMYTLMALLLAVLVCFGAAADTRVTTLAVPTAQDIPKEEALAIAKEAIERECGVPPETLDAEYRLDMELCLLSLRSAEKERVWCVDFRRLDPASGSWELCYSAQVMAEDGTVCHAGDNGGNG